MTDKTLITLNNNTEFKTSEDYNRLKKLISQDLIYAVELEVRHVGNKSKNKITIPLKSILYITEIEHK